MEWPNTEVNWLPLISGIRKLETFVRGFHVVNDPTERSLKFVKVYKSTSQNEDLLKNRILSASEQRKKFSNNMTKEYMKNM